MARLDEVGAERRGSVGARRRGGGSRGAPPSFRSRGCSGLRRPHVARGSTSSRVPRPFGSVRGEGVGALSCHPAERSVRRARHQIPDLPRDRPTVPDVLSDAVALLHGPRYGCCLHVVLADRNLGLEDVRWSWRQAFRGCPGDRARCLRVASAMRAMTSTQRRRLAWLASRLGASGEKIASAEKDPNKVDDNPSSRA